MTVDSRRRLSLGPSSVEEVCCSICGDSNPRRSRIPVSEKKQHCRNTPEYILVVYVHVISAESRPVLSRFKNDLVLAVRNHCLSLTNAVSGHTYRHTTRA